MTKSLTLDQVGSMFGARPVKAGQPASTLARFAISGPVTYRVTVCELCEGDVLTVLPDEPDDIVALRFVHAHCVDF